MFSGIIQHTGRVVSVENVGTTLDLVIASTLSGHLHIDQSLSHDGVCLTVVEVMDNKYRVQVVEETLSKTTFSDVQAGREVNLETAISLSTLLDGHLVQGHVDTILRCISKEDQQGSWLFRFHLPEEFTALVVEHGSICLNGVSLTVANMMEDSFEVAIIPFTYTHTNFQSLLPGDYVNAEFDVIGKYLLRQTALFNK